MALEETNTTKATFLNIWDGSICQRYNEHREGYERHEKDGKVFYVKRYQGFSGYISDINWFDREIAGGKRITGWNIVVEDDGETYQLSMPLKSAATTVFMNVAGNINFKQPVHFSAWKDKEGKTAFLLRQPDKTGETVKRCHTRDNPNGIPQAKKRASGEWDFGDVEDFLMEKMKKEIIPVCKRTAQERQSEMTVTSEEFATVKANAQAAGSDGWKGSLGENDYSVDDDSSIPF